MKSCLLCLFTLIQITLNGVSLPTNGLSGNQVSLVNSLNTVTPVLPSSLFNLSGPQLAVALNTISPSRNSFANFATVNTLFSLSSLVDLRMRKGFEMGNEPSFEPVTHLVSENFDGITFLTHSEIDDEDELGEETSVPYCCENTQPFDLWAAGFGDFSKQKAQKQNPAFNVNTGGLIVGFDYNIPCNCLDTADVGIALAYTHSRIHEHAHFGHANINTGYGALYGSFSTINFFLELASWNGFARTQNNREIFFPGFSGATKSAFDMYVGDIHGSFGYDYDVCFNSVIATFEPFVSIDWAYNVQESFKEKGAAPFNTAQESRFASILRSEIGLHNYFTWKNCGWTLCFYDKLSWVYKKPFDLGRIKANIVGSPSSFVVESFTKTQNLFSPSLSLSALAEGGLYFSIYYDGEFGSGYRLNEVEFRIGRYF